VNQVLVDYYRLLPDALLPMTTNAASASGDVGFFKFGTNEICYGRSQSGVAQSIAGCGQFNAFKDVRNDGTAVEFPFEISEVVENLRRERYRRPVSGIKILEENDATHSLYYAIRGLLPVSTRRRLQRLYFRGWQDIAFPHWPVDFTVDNLHEETLRLLMEISGVKKLPFIWFWPEGASSCLILTHDIETLAGRDFVPQLMDLDDSYGFKASFEVVPEKRYPVPDQFVQEIRSRGFEFNIHDLNHDGGLYRDRSEFLNRAAQINSYAHRFGARGFRAGSMYRNQDWFDAFEFSYDMSVPNVAHLDPMRGGCCTVMPYFIGNIVELPVTTTQDYSLFYILKDYSINLWKQQLGLIRGRNGLISIISHPDYLIERRARRVYESLLDHLRQMTVNDQIWTALPGEVDLWWRARSEMRLVRRENEWEIVGPGRERARVAYATLEGGRLVYELADVSTRQNAAR
jgi:hypothetical protein